MRIASPIFMCGKVLWQTKIGVRFYGFVENVTVYYYFGEIFSFKFFIEQSLENYEPQFSVLTQNSSLKFE